MGIRNSSLTRVKPLFDFINSDVDKLNRFFSLFNFKNQRIAHNSLIEIRYGYNEKKIPPSKTLLIWMLQNLNDLNKLANYGVDNIDSETYKNRKLLFSGNAKVLDEAINRIQTHNEHPQRGWFIFEGNSSPDIFIETNDSIFVGEAKRTEKDITTKTKWLSQRDQLIRHIDSLLDQRKKIYSFYILEKDEYLKGYYKERMELYSKKDYFKLNLRHRDDEITERAYNSFIGFVFWEDIADYFNICFPDTTQQEHQI
jgi:hypothetical protein